MTEGEPSRGHPLRAPDHAVDAHRSAAEPATRDPGNTPAAANPSTGDIASAIRAPNTPTGRPSWIPPQFTALTPAVARAEPTSPPISAWLELDGIHAAR